VGQGADTDVVKKTKAPALQGPPFQSPFLSQSLLTEVTQFALQFENRSVYRIKRINCLWVLFFLPKEL